jgi:formylglycine-generating enzyme required for sulfatase activity
LELAINDLVAAFGSKYPKGQKFLERLAALKRAGQQAARGKGDPAAAAHVDAELSKLRQEALLANPLLDFDKLLLIKRSAGKLGLPANWQGNCSLPKNGYDNEIAVLSPIGPEGKLMTLYRPPNGEFVGDVDLHFDADRILFSMPAIPSAGEQGTVQRKRTGNWQVFELRADVGASPARAGQAGGTGPRQITGEQDDVDSYDACYLPSGRIIFCSSACYLGVPCVRGSDHVANLYVMDSNGGGIRQLCFDQDHNWHPSVLNNGRVLFTRWEYCDLPHAFSRLLFHMNPDGTEQMEYYGSNSYWPNSIFYARAIPLHPTKVVGIVSGHHGTARAGELVIFDPAAGRFEADGVVQRIPGYGKRVEPVLLDELVDASWPKFLHPYPLSEKHFLVSCKPAPSADWGVYLVDVFDNMVLLHETPKYALLEPIPLRKTPTPPVIPDKVDLGRKDAEVYLVDVHVGDGLKGVPRGTIRKLRLFTYQFAYYGMGGQYDRIGLDGPWDVKRIIGTVPVCEDGSARFRVPANTPISVQPLDEEGKAVQLMRSWFTAMPGENVSCVGCHERQSTTPPVGRTVAATRPPVQITPWYGPTRGFGFEREVQVVLDEHCVGCHNGQARPDGKVLPDLRAMPPVLPVPGHSGTGKFPPAYYALRRFVRAPSIESDLHMLAPWDYHADSTDLVRLLRKGHQNVKLDAEDWDRLVTWIDLNTPAYGTWHEIVGMGKVAQLRDRRRELQKLYAGIDEDPEAIPAVQPPRRFVAPEPLPQPKAQAVQCPGWPFDASEAAGRQSRAGDRTHRTMDLGDGVTMELVLVPAGEFVMGDANGLADEAPPARVKIDAPFWMGKCEVTNEQYRRFEPSHDSRLQDGHFLQFSVRERGYPLNAPRQPVVRVSCRQAAAFCKWLSQKTGDDFTLPTEAQWEHACRAGTDSPLYYGETDTDHARFANLADISINRIERLGWNLPVGAIPPWHPTDGRFDDKARVSAEVGSYQPNAWGLHDMHGNVWEWTRTKYRPYPYRQDDGRNDQSATGRNAVRGGSWYDRAKCARSAYRLSYPPHQTVFNVGFRVVCPVRPAEAKLRT